MFGNNEIVGRSFFKNKTGLAVTSMFFTLQGEGPLSGVPALFVRLAKCNLACSFCDTFFDRGDNMSFEDLDLKIHETVCGWFHGQNLHVPSWLMDWRKSAKSTLPGSVSFNCALVVTGGEPLLQPNLKTFLERQLNNFTAVQIETNGTIDQEIPDEVTVVCSPKCFERDGKPVRHLKPTQFILERANYLKFVLSEDADSPYNQVPDWAFQWRDRTDRTIYVSPMNIYNDLPHKAKLLRASKEDISLEERSTVDEVVDWWAPNLLNMKANEANHKYAAHYAMKHGLRLNLQMHLFAGLA